MKNLYKIFFVTFLALFLTQIVKGQDLLMGKDLSQIKVDQLSDADISKLKNQLASSGTTIEQAEQTAIAKGMPASEFAKLKQRILSYESNGLGVGKLKPNLGQAYSGKSNNSTDSLDKEKYNDNQPKSLINPLIFGSELYTSVSPSFEPNMKLATPLNYILGPDDQILVSVYGVQEYNGDLLISSEGEVTIPSIGKVKLAGLTIEAATQKLKLIMGSTIYTYLRSGASKISVTLSKIRSIKVNIIGSNRPGTFNISSLSTVFNALYLAGGPSSFGSFREIELVRQGQPVKKIDLYRFLLHGDQSDNIGLKDNDVIRIPAYKTRVELQGQFKRPGIFEVLPGETFADILEFASGFTDTAYTSIIKTIQRNEKERIIQDLEASAFKSYLPKSGDVFVCSKILNRYKNRVRIAGAVFRPDIYELKEGFRVADIIRKSDGLKEDAFIDRGQIIRLEENLTRSILDFDIRKALAGDEKNNILLHREDEIFISSVLDLKDSFKITIQGEIRVPGQYDFVKNLTLKDLIVQAGGFTDAAYKKIEIARLLKRDSISGMDNRASEIIQTEVNEMDLGSSSLTNIPLKPFDLITIRRKAGYTLPETVRITGQIQYPGPYALNNRNEKVSDLLRRSGGFTPDANPDGAYLKRPRSAEDKQKAEELVKNLRKSIKDSTGSTTNEILRDYDKVPLDLSIILKNIGSPEDLVLKAGDELYIPKFDGQVKISGEVLLSTQIPFVSNNFKSYISAAGGFSTNALRRKAYIVYANGKAATATHFMFFKFYPKVLPGSEIVVPKRAEKKGSSTGEVIGIASALASLAGVVIAILRL